MNNEKLTQMILSKWRTSPIIQDMHEADLYYRNENIEISLKRRGFTNPKTKQFQSIDTVSNEKLYSGFIRQSVNQKVDYGFGKPFILQVDKLDDKVSDDLKKRYSNEWNKFITPEFRSELKSIATEAINNGIGWGFVYIDPEDEKLKVDCYRSETIYPKWVNDKHKKLDALVRDYYKEEYTDDGIKYINYVEFWNDKITEQYTAQGTALTLQDEFTHLANNESWDRIPFVFLKSSKDEIPLLKLIKSYIDGYDKLNSKSVDTLIDDIEAILVLKGMSAEIHDLQEARELLAALKMTAVDEQGDASYLQANVSIDNIQKKLENLKKDIKEFSCTVNTQDIQFGSNPSGVALKAAYQDLDIYMNDIETEFELFMQQLKYFFDKWLVFRGLFTEQELTQLDITATLNRDMMINETELIENTVKLSGTNVSQETIDGYNPAVESYEIEQERREKEEKEQSEHDNPYKFPERKTDEEEEDEEIEENLEE